MFRGRHDKALSLLRDVLSIAPNHSDARLRLAQCALSEGDLKQARDALTELKEARMKNPFLEFLEGSLLHSEGQFDEADQIFNTLEDNLPLTQSTLNLFEALGAARMKAKMPEKAQVCYEKILKIAPESVPALNGIGEAKRQQKNYEGAEDSFVASLKILQAQPNVLTALGKSQLARGLDPEAEKSFLQALEIEPDFASAHDALRKVRGRKTALTLKADEARNTQ
jgi:tetratricopeptide (TPR) repeat protein